jgi:hypothetical protein
VQVRGGQAQGRITLETPPEFEAWWAEGEAAEAARRAAKEARAKRKGKGSGLRDDAAADEPTDEPADDGADAPDSPETE